MPRVPAVTVTLIAALAAGGLVTSCADDSLTDRREAVAERGAEVMPFDLDATTHVFTRTGDGGTQVVTADTPGDSDQIELIRAHLREERDDFARGDFDDPARIHGHDMPGVAELQAGYADITVAYADVPAGGQLTYTTADPVLVDAIHRWFDRQLADHGPDAEAG